MSSGSIYIPPESYVLAQLARLARIRPIIPWSAWVGLALRRFESDPNYRDFGYDVRECESQLSDLPKGRRSLASFVDCLYGCHELHGTSTVSPAWGDKTPLNTLRIRRLAPRFPEAHWVHLVRHGADVALSYVRMGRYPSLLEAGQRWIDSLAAVSAAEGKGLSTCTILYEDLVVEPAQVAAKVLQPLVGNVFIDLEWRPPDVGDWSLSHHESVAEKVTASSVGRHTEELSAADRRNLGNLINPWLERHGYRPL